MISDYVNGAVHVLALLIFFILFYIQLKNRRERDLLGAFLKGSYLHRVQVDWPYRFFRNFCSALNIPFHAEGLSLFSIGSPQRLRKELLFETLLLYGIDEIEYRVEASRQVHVKIYVSKKPPNLEILEKDLCTALGVELRILEPLNRGNL